MAEAAPVQEKKERKPPKDGPSRTTLFVQNLPEDCTQTMLEQSFGDVAPIRRALLVTEKGDKTICKGFGFVTFAMEADAKKALEHFHGKSFLGNRLRVDYAKSRQRGAGQKRPTTELTAEEQMKLEDAQKQEAAKRQQARARREQHKKPKVEQQAVKRWRLIVRNLDFNATTSDIEATFKDAGKVLEVVRPPRKDGKGPSGFAFVQMASKQDADNALKKVNGIAIKGRQVAVDLALDKRHYLEHVRGSEEGAKALEQKEETAEERPNKSARNITGKVKKEEPEENLSSTKKLKREPIEEEEHAETASVAGEESEDEDDDDDDDDEEADPLASSDEEEASEAGEDAPAAKAKKAAERQTIKIKQEPQDSDEEEEEDVGQENRKEKRAKVKKEQGDQTGEKKVKKEPGAGKKISNDVVEGRTIFLRNLPFNVTEEELEQRSEFALETSSHGFCSFSTYGALKYCVLTIDKVTGLPKGSGFLQFETRESADRLLADAYPNHDVSTPTPSTPSEVRVHGRQLIISRAIARGEAASISAKQDEKSRDKRNLYLAMEGGSEAAEGVSKEDMEKRVRGEKEKRTKLTNPNFFVSNTRLSVRNIPLTVDEKRLKKIFLDAARETGPNAPKVKQVKLMREKDRLDLSGKPKSKGIGFVEFVEHPHALAALRAINNNPDLFGPARRPIVEFAIENALHIQARSSREAKRHGPGPKRAADAPPPVDVDSISPAPKKAKFTNGTVSPKAAAPTPENRPKQASKQANWKQPQQRQPQQHRPQKERQKPPQQWQKPAKPQDSEISGALKGPRAEKKHTKRDRSVKHAHAEQEEGKFRTLVDSYKARMEAAISKPAAGKGKRWFEE